MPIYEKSTRELLNEWAEKYIEPAQTFSKSMPLQWFAANYPETKATTIRAHMSAMSTNSQSRIHHPVRPGSGHGTFFQTGRDEFRLYDPENDPDPTYKSNGENNSVIKVGSPEANEQSDDVVESVAGGEFALERHLQEFLVRNLHQIEPGLSPYFDDLKDCLEVDAGGRRIDILARDNAGCAVVLELKVSRGYDRVIGQLLRYMGWVRRNLEEGEPVRGIIVASEISDDLKLAVSELSCSGSDVI
jgi:hypothetical protein